MICYNSYMDNKKVYTIDEIRNILFVAFYYFHALAAVLPGRKVKVIIYEASHF